MNTQFAVPDLPEPSYPAHEPAAAEAAPEFAGTPHSMTRVLRWLGAITLIAAGSCYLVSTWMSSAPLTRFYSFLGFTSLLGALGIFCGVRWKEDKGARTFLGLAALFVPAGVAQLGAMIHAQFGMAAVPLRFDALVVQPVGALPLLLAALAGAVALAPVCLLAFSAFSRAEGKRLTSVYMISNLVLLLPFRQADHVALVAGVLLAFHIFSDRRFFAEAPLMRHWDGITVRFLLGLPLLVLIGRTMSLYETSHILNGVVLGAASSLLLFGVPQVVRSESLRTAAWLGGLALCGSAWLEFSEVLVSISKLDRVEAIVPCRVLPLCAIAFLLSQQKKPESLFLRKMAGATATVALLVQIAVFGGMVTTVVSLAVAVGLVAGAFWLGDRLLLGSGATGFIVTLANALFSVREFWAQNLWATLGSAGVLILLAASLIERNWPRIQKSGVALRHHWESWD